MKIKKNIFMILDNTFPPDIRVEKEAKTLNEQNHNVFIIAKKENKKQKENESVNYATIIRLNIPIQTLLSKLNHTITYLTGYNFLWSKEIKKIIKKYQIDFFHVHDLYLCKTIIKLSQKHNIPVISDLHENYPEAINMWNNKSNDNILKKLFFKFLYNYNRWYKIEKFTCKNSYKIIAVIDEMKKLLIKKHSVDENKIIVIPNTEYKSFCNQNLITQKKDIEKQFTLSFIGGVGGDRGIETVLNAIPNIVDKIPNFKFLIVGANPKLNYTKKLTKIINKLKINNYVTIINWVPFEKVIDYMIETQVGIIPHFKNTQTDNTIPHKLFQYLLTGTPVIVSNCNPLERIVNETKSGVVFKSDNYNSLSNEIIKLYKDKNRYTTFKKNAISHSHHGKYNWESTSIPLLKLYNI